VILGVLTAVANTLVVIPQNASSSERIAYTVGAFLGAVLVTLIAAYVWAFIRAPYEQRDALRTAMATTRAEVQALIDKREAEDDRRKRLRTDINLTDETFYLWELFDLDAGQQPIIRGRTFTRCVLKGPAVILFQLGVGDMNFKDTKLAELNNRDIETILFEIPPPPVARTIYKQGVIGIVNCRFDNCTFLGVAVTGQPEVLELIRKIPQI